MTKLKRRSELDTDGMKLLNRLCRVAGRNGFRVLGHQGGGWSLTPLGTGPRGRPADGEGMSLEELRTTVCGPRAYPGS